MPELTTRVGANENEHHPEPIATQIATNTAQNTPHTCEYARADHERRSK